MTTRTRPPDRRRRIGFDMEHDGHRYTVCAGYFDDGHLAEVFFTTRKAGSSSDAIARDSALLFSLLLQYGCPIETIRAALMTGPDGRTPAGVLGAALNCLAERGELVLAPLRRSS